MTSVKSVMLRKVVALGGIPKVSTYSVSKAALNAMTKIHAYELQEARIRCAGDLCMRVRAFACDEQTTGQVPVCSTLNHEKHEESDQKLLTLSPCFCPRQANRC